MFVAGSILILRLIWPLYSRWGAMAGDDFCPGFAALARGTIRGEWFRERSDQRFRDDRATSPGGIGGAGSIP